MSPTPFHKWCVMQVLRELLSPLWVPGQCLFQPLPFALPFPLSLAADQYRRSQRKLVRDLL